MWEEKVLAQAMSLTPPSFPKSTAKEIKTKGINYGQAFNE